jgi:hypothetical protein
MEGKTMNDDDEEQLGLPIGCAIVIGTYVVMALVIWLVIGR